MQKSYVNNFKFEKGTDGGALKVRCVFNNCWVRYNDIRVKCKCTKRTQLFSLAACQSVDQQTPNCVGDPVGDYVELTDGPSIALECQ